MAFLEALSRLQQDGILNEKFATIARRFYDHYVSVLKAQGRDPLSQDEVLILFLRLVAKQLASPFAFENFHNAITSPIDYYSFGIEMFRPMVNKGASKVLGLDNIKRMEEQLQAKDNIFLLANHQSELDPQVISLLLEDTYPQFAKNMAFVAGDRVLTDPMAAPFSMGRNLFCIYSKRHIDKPPERKEEKLRYNQRTMQAMQQKLSEGGMCIYIAPSGGRDRRNAQGIIEVAPFDAQSLEMLFLTARQAGRTTHFYPLALSSYALLPPPDAIGTELGEWRSTSYTPLHAAFGQEIDIETFPGNDLADKKARRQARAEHIHALVVKDYQRLHS